MHSQKEVEPGFKPSMSNSKAQALSHSRSFSLLSPLDILCPSMAPALYKVEVSLPNGPFLSAEQHFLIFPIIKEKMRAISLHPVLSSIYQTSQKHLFTLTDSTSSAHIRLFASPSIRPHLSTAMLCPRSLTTANWMASLHAPFSWTWSTDRVTRQLARAPVHIGLLKHHWNLNKWRKLFTFQNSSQR